MYCPTTKAGLNLGRSIVVLRFDTERTMPMRCSMALLLTYVGCGGADAIQLLDVSQLPLKCDLRAQSGCNAAEKCTWILEESPRGGCTVEGTTPIGQSCQRPLRGADDCVIGAACLNEVCREICSLEGGVPECRAGFHCVAFPIEVEQTNAGVCVPQ